MIGRRIAMIGVYKITNSITNEFYIGSSKNVQKRWRNHRSPSTWNHQPNSRLYSDMKQYGRDKFIFEIVEEVADIAELKSREQYYIELYQPVYNQRVANTGLDTTDYKQYHHTEEYKEYRKQYKKQYSKQYDNRICEYNGEQLSLSALSKRFKRQGIDHPTIEAKKYLIQNQ
jgi:group I intron endonuclease